MSLPAFRTGALGRRWSATCLLLAALAVALLATASPAAAITNGEPDGTGHPNVGLLRITVPEGVKYCTGTLVSSSVVVTAGHCTYGATRIQVSFAPTNPIPLTSTLTGQPFTFPGFTPDASTPSDLRRANDLGVVVLDRAQSGISPARLPAAGQLDDLERKQRRLIVVGYGIVAADARLDGTRRVAESEVQGVSDLYVRARDKGAKEREGICEGDSGAPTFLGSSSTIAAVVSFAKNTRCNGAAFSAYRLDTPEARGFLGRFVRLP